MIAVPDAVVRTAQDVRDDRRVLLATAGVLLVVFSLGATLQAVFVFRPEHLTFDEIAAQSPQVPARLLANLAAVALVLAVCGLVRLNERTVAERIGIVIALAVAAGVARHALQIVLGIYDHPIVAVSLVEMLSVTAVVILCLSIGMLQVRARVRLREHERAAADHRLRAGTALTELAAEETRVRRQIAEELHGTLQGKLVLSQALLSAIRSRGGDDAWDPAALEQLDRLADQLDAIRERDVRELSQLVHPVGVDAGLAHAVGSLVRRIPPEIAVSADVSPSADRMLAGGDGASVAMRVAVVRGIEEGITNALRHGAATEIRIAVTSSRPPDGPRVTFTVDDDGAGLPDGARWNGLATLARRLRLHGGALELEPSSLGGAQLAGELRVPAATGG
jgi:signal transduction histidine kinase